VKRPGSLSKLIHLLTILAVWILPSLSLNAAEPHFSYRTFPLYAQTKIFLVAGSGKNANFAQEIVDQKKIWKKAGFADNEIACYYVIPSLKEFKGDAAQFSELAPELSDCYPASVALIRKHIRLIGKAKDKPPFLYLYMTSHGDRPLSYDLSKAHSLASEGRLSELKSRFPVLNQYLLRIDGLQDREAATFSDILKDYQQGVDPEELFMTPSYLRNLLEGSFKDVPKFIVIQGCFSGGFVEEPSEAFRDQTLKSLPTLTILTASRFDRTSFGCQPGETRTYFGGIFNEALEGKAEDPRRMDWKALSDDVKVKVSAKEKIEKHLTPSEPVFFSNSGGETTPMKASIFIPKD
jgi:hypothetical protein